MSTVLQASLFEFLQDIKDNNNRPWFAENKPQYQAAVGQFKSFMATVVDRLSFHDKIEGNKAKVFRIYRDVRFSKNKTPYKTNFSAGLQRAGKLRRGGYYISLSPNENIVGGGFFQPERADLLRIRQDIAADDEPLQQIIAAEQFQSFFGNLQGEQLKTAPRGFPKDHQAIDLLRHKSFIVTRSFQQAEVLSAHFLDQVVETYLAMHPFFDYMTEVLTTDANGELIV
ncbi:MAG: DUF2461 domain-containing protein [Bacteroidota bacterium]